jgi:23S rRNA (cytosine1962-C5)-methyltransferase
MKTIRLRAAKDRSLLRRHPWVFESSIERGKADPGETVRVEAHDGRFLAWAAFSPASKIRLRAWSFDEAERIDAGFLQRRVARAVAVARAPRSPSDGVRLVHGEADGLPGLVADRYADTLSVQFLSAGVERWKAVLADALLKSSGAARLYERSDTSSRALEGLEPRAGWLRGEGPTEVTIREHDWRLTLDVAQGHKTGYYLDQRDNRRRFADAVRLFGCQRVLNCYAYTGGFGVAALAGGAGHVTSVDSSAPALERADAHVVLNGFDASRHAIVDADVNRTLREALEAGRATTRSFSIRRSSRPARRTPNVQRAPTRTSTGLRSSCSSRAGCCSPSRVRVASRSTCSTRSSPARASMPASTAWSTRASAPHRTTR